MYTRHLLAIPYTPPFLFRYDKFIVAHRAWFYCSVAYLYHYDYICYCTGNEISTTERLYAVIGKLVSDPAALLGRHLTEFSMGVLDQTDYQTATDLLILTYTYLHDLPKRYSWFELLRSVMRSGNFITIRYINSSNFGMLYIETTKRGIA